MSKAIMNPMYPQQLSGCPYCGLDDSYTEMLKFNPKDGVIVRSVCRACKQDYHLTLLPVAVSLATRDTANSQTYCLGRPLQDNATGKIPADAPLVGIELDGAHFCVRVSGYGEREANDGYGSPVFLELYDGKLRAIVRDDINDGDNKVLELDRARYTARDQAKEYFPYRVEFTTPGGQLIEARDCLTKEAAVREARTTLLPYGHRAAVYHTVGSRDQWAELYSRTEQLPEQDRGYSVYTVYLSNGKPLRMGIENELVRQHTFATQEEQRAFLAGLKMGPSPSVRFFIDRHEATEFVEAKLRGEL